MCPGVVTGSFFAAGAIATRFVASTGINANRQTGRFWSCELAAEILAHKRAPFCPGAAPSFAADGIAADNAARTAAVKLRCAIVRDERARILHRSHVGDGAALWLRPRLPVNIA
jgi:hypothetical protein